MNISHAAGLASISGLYSFLSLRGARSNREKKTFCAKKDTGIHSKRWLSTTKEGDSCTQKLWFFAPKNCDFCTPKNVIFAPQNWVFAPLTGILHLLFAPLTMSFCTPKRWKSHSPKKFLHSMRVWDPPADWIIWSPTVATSTAQFNPKMRLRFGLKPNFSSCLFLALKDVRAGFRQNGFFADFYFWAAGFFRGFCRRTFSPHFCGKKCPEKSARKIPGKILQNLYDKNPPTHFCRLPRAKDGLVRTPAVLQWYNAIVNLLCVVDLLSHNDLLSRPPCADLLFLGIIGIFPPAKKGSQRSKFGGHSKKHYLGGRFGYFLFLEGANREKLTVKKRSSITRFFFHRLCPL